MNPSVDLAIVIPAFKGQYFSRAIQSISQQTSKRFRLYIGDDCSPHNLREMLLDCIGDVDFDYHRFNENLGQKNLAQHWERCLDMTQDEPWIWLFSDDDVMDDGCVEMFYQTLEQYPQYDIYHFNKLYINQDHQILNIAYPDYPDVLSSGDFLKRRLRSDIHSTVVEYVFRKSLFAGRGRFKKFDLAWGTDDALCIDLARPNGIKAIKGAKVYWRTSPHNITTNRSDTEILLRKFDAEIEFKEWIQYLLARDLLDLTPDHVNQELELWFLQKIRDRVEYLPFSTIKKLLFKFRNSGTGGRPLKKESLYSYKVYRHVSQPLKKAIGWNKLKMLVESQRFA